MVYTDVVMLQVENKNMKVVWKGKVRGLDEGLLWQLKEKDVKINTFVACTMRQMIMSFIDASPAERGARSRDSP